MPSPPPSPKSRLRAVYTVPADRSRRTEEVVYQLEDSGHPELRLRPTVRLRTTGDLTSYVYRVDAFSRLTGTLLGHAEVTAQAGSEAEYAAEARQYNAPPFRETFERLSARLADQLKDTEPTGAVQV